MSAIKIEILNSSEIFLTNTVFYVVKNKKNRTTRNTTYVWAVIILLDALPDVELSTSELDILPYTHWTASDKSYLALAGIKFLTELLSISASGHLDHYTTDTTDKIMQFQL